MKTEILIEELKKLSIDDLGDVLMEVGAFRNAQVGKEDVEDFMECILDYEEYDGVDNVDVFIFPRKNEDLLW